MNDEDFCRAIGCPTGIKRDLAEKVRRVTGELCKVDPNAITPDEDTGNLNSKTFDDWDDVAFLMGLEKALGRSLEEVRLPNFIMERFFFLHKKPEPLNYGEWVKRVVETLAPQLTNDINSP